MAVAKSKKTAAPAPTLTTEPSQEDPVAQAVAALGVWPMSVAVPERPTPERYPHLFDEFGNRK